MTPSIWQLLLVLVVVIIIFGAGKLPNAMKDFGKGIRNLREGLKGENDENADKNIENKKSKK